MYFNSKLSILNINNKGVNQVFESSWLSAIKQVFKNVVNWKCLQRYSPIWSIVLRLWLRRHCDFRHGKFSQKRRMIDARASYIARMCSISIKYGLEVSSWICTPIGGTFEKHVAFICFYVAGFFRFFLIYY